ncbi:MAG: hypothetical protein NZT61_02350 [Deltaproteobacteria bacterium]|nr:hypothetical protein [Deltaproteobacteria bacterium]MCX7952211.1 hypothetical protein [Deltaproteobacteria bacterium]
MRLLIFSIGLLLFLVLSGFFIFHNLNIVEVKFWKDFQISAPIGVVVLGACAIGVGFTVLWYLWGSFVSYLKLKSKDTVISQLIELYQNTVILNQAFTLGEKRLAQDQAQKLKSPVKELEFFVELEKTKIVTDPAERVKVLESLRSKFPTNPYLAYELVVSFLRLGQEQLAFDHIKSFNQMVSTAMSLRLGVELALKLVKLEEASQWLTELKKIGYADHALQQKYLELKVEQSYLEGKDWYSETKRLLKDYPYSLVGLEYMAKYYQPTNPVLCAKYYRQRAEVGKSLQFWRDLIEFLKTVGKIEDAVKTAKEAMEKSISVQDRSLAKLDLVRLLISINNWAEAEEVLNSFSEEELSATANVPVDRLCKFYSAFIKMKRGSAVESLRVLDSILAV